jgi:hypothetical protein
MAPPKVIEERIKALPYEERLYAQFSLKVAHAVVLTYRLQLSSGDEIAINFNELSFKFGAIEPFFCTLALYDYNEKRKISEDFHFHLNTPEQLEMIGAPVRTLGWKLCYDNRTVSDQAYPLQADVDPAIKARKAVFRVSPTSKHPDVYFVLIVSKVLKGELDDHYDTYLKSTVRSICTWFG